jgi:hypothetical protein
MVTAWTCVYIQQRRKRAPTSQRKEKKKPRRLSDQSVSGSAPVFQLKSSFHHSKFIFWKRNFAMKLFDVLIVVAIFIAAGSHFDLFLFF